MVLTTALRTVDAQQLVQRLDDAARIAGRMAHDFDNVMTGVLGFGELAQPYVGAGSPGVAYLAELLKVSEVGRSITEQMHQFSHAGYSHPQPSSVAVAWRALEPDLRHRHGSAVSWVSNLPGNLPMVAVANDPLQLAVGVLLNNAAEASPAGGRVCVTATVVDGPACGIIGRLAAGPHVAITVTDNGPGIAPALLPRLFAEPFLTTKPRHRGLGLATLYRLLVAHHADATLACPPAGGTVATLFLPLTPNPLPPGRSP